MLRGARTLSRMSTLTDEQREELEARLADIEAILAGGLTTIAVDGVSMTVDLRALERERRRINKLLSGRRPTFRRFTLHNVNP